MDLPIKITDRAISEVADVLQNKNIPEGYGLRIGVKGGACSGSFFLGFDKVEEGDLAFEFKNVPIYLEKRQLMYLINLKLDFVEEEEQQGFVFVKD
jgi:iron-sulfur cluster assembly protein